MRVYLDNNILIDIENGLYSAEDFLNIEGAEYYFSNAHLNELLNVEQPIEGLKEKRLTTIEKLCGNKYLFQNDSTNVVFASCTPRLAYERASSVDSMRVIINNSIRGFNPNRTGLQKELGINAREIGNYKPEDIFDAIEKIIMSSMKKGIKDYLILTEAFTLSTVYITLFNLLDIVGYRKDKNNVARLYDSVHAYYAQKCDILVSNDARMCAKAKAVYHYMHVATQVMSAKSFLDIYL